MRTIAVPQEWERQVRIVTDVTDEDLRAWLSPVEINEMARLRHERQRAERAASRIAAKSLALELALAPDSSQIEFAKTGEKPRILLAGRPAGLSLSLSHTAGTGAAALGTHSVGIDLEHHRAIDPRATKFFLAPSEREMAAHCLLGHALLHFWCAKEAAFKLQNAKPTLLKVEIRLIAESDDGLRFEFAEGSVETRCLGEHLVIALARQ